MVQRIVEYEFKLVFCVIRTCRSRFDVVVIAMYFVDENYQGRGIGRKLYDAVCGLNTDNYFTANASPYAKEIYEHMGFECQQEMQQVNGIKFYPMKGIVKNKNITR